MSLKLKNMTEQERSFWEMLPEGLQQISTVTMSYQNAFVIINEHLRTIYGERTDWKKCISAYQESDFYRNGSHIVRKCEDMSLVTTDEIRNMLAEEEQDQAKAAELVSMLSSLSSDEKDTAEKATLEAAKILGILPDSQEGLFTWIVNKEGMTEKERQELWQRIHQEQGLLNMIVKELIDSYVPGMLLTYPIIGTAMTQPKARYYYRGENAFYGQSRPGAYRNMDSKLPFQVQEIVNRLRWDEGCGFFDHFDAVKYWGNSTVNYLALAQHYGLWTPMMDVTSDLLTALFFACCKFGNDGKWHPLTKRDFAKADSRAAVKKLGGDSRYAVLYRSPSEITDMKWAVENVKGDNIISPVGYQPFMRCKSQHAYMFMTLEEKYDMLVDPLFEKMRFRLDEDFCEWVFEKSDRGNAIYPNEDIPDLSNYMAKINHSHHFSQSTFEALAEQRNYTENEKVLIKAMLKKYGFHIMQGNGEYITANELRKINKRYTIDRAFQLTEVTPISRPHIVVTSGK